MKDQVGRTIDYMRISLTDRCNLRCRYCMPQDIEKIEMSQLLTYEEIAVIAKCAVELGIVNFKLTGGEPLVRKNVPVLVEMLKAIPGVKTVTMTTNGTRLSSYAAELKKAGLDGINVSLDTLDAGAFAKLTGQTFFPLSSVLEGIKATQQADIPLKLNTVNRRDLDWKTLLSYAKDRHLIVRFIEMMPIGYGKDYMGTSNKDLFAKIQELYGTGTPVTARKGNGPANYYRFENYPEEIGFISAIHHKFCDTCNRIRLSSEGYLKLCLCYEQGMDLRELLRNGSSMREIKAQMQQAIARKPMEHCFSEKEKMTEKQVMAQIGG